MLSEQEYASNLIQQLEALANPAKADAMEAYMKNKFPFLGINAPERKALLKSFIRAHRKPKPEQVDFILRELWISEYREAQHLGIDLLEKTKYFKHPESLDLFEWLITNKSHWDTVDLLASTHVAGYFKSFPTHKEKIVLKWNKSGYLWLIRTSIIFQIKYRTETNIELLKTCITPHVSNKEFFIQKAIGWSLRALSRTNPKRVAQLVEELQLTGLAKREALKYV